MSKLGKNLVWVALVGVAVSAVFGFLMVGKSSQITQQKEKVIKELGDKSAELEKIQKDLAEKQASLDDTSKKLDESKTQADALQAELGKEQQRASELEAAVKAASDKALAAEQHVKRISDSLDGKSAEEIKAATLKAQAELLAAKTDRKQLENQLQSVKSEVARLTGALRRSAKGEMPPGLSGKVQSINKNWNFVVINLGDKDGVVRNAMLVVYRSKLYIGRVKVSSTESNTCVADIVPEKTKAEIHVGDDVLN
jgi:cell shape-determining protein MreC